MSSDIHNEDQSVPYAHSPGGTPQEDKVGNMRLVSHSNDKAPLEVNRQQVMLELIDESSPGERFGLDLVAVLDVSESMGQWDRLAKVKTAMQFVIKKLRPIDRLSIVTFSTNAKRLCHLRSVTKAFQAHLKELVDGLKAGGSTNIKHGLQTGQQVLTDRRLTGGRVASIFVLSDGEVNDAKVGDVSDVAVYTFGFGADCDHKVLEGIARESKGGTFNYVDDTENMIEPFSQILGGLLSVVIQDLKLTVSPHPGDSTIENVQAGFYPQTKVHGSVIVSFGDLFAREVRKVIVDVLLLDVPSKRKSMIALIAQCSYSIQGKPFFSRKLTVTISRVTGPGAADPNRKPEAVRIEIARVGLAKSLEEACTMADHHDLDGAREKLEEAKNDLKVLEQSNSIVDILMTQLDKLLEMIWNSLPDLRLRLRLLGSLRSLKTSHDRQRPAATGYVNGVRLFKTEFTEASREQGKFFKKNRNMEVPPVEDDFKKVKQQRPVRDEQGQGMGMDTPPAVATEAWTCSWWPGDLESHQDSRWAWAMVMMCMVLAIGVTVIGGVLFAVYLFYARKMPSLAVSDAQLGVLQYAVQGGTIQHLQMSITILAKNDKSEADASFSPVDLALEFHGAVVAVLRTPAPFVVAPGSSLPLHYNVVSAERTLDQAGMRAMFESLNAGVVPLQLHGKVRTRWKVGIFLKTKYWTRISCRLRFFYPGNGTVMPTDRHRCRSRSP